MTQRPPEKPNDASKTDTTKTDCLHPGPRNVAGTMRSPMSPKAIGISAKTVTVLWVNWSSNRGRWGTVLSTAMDPATNAMDAVARWMNATLRDSGFLGCTASVTFNPEKVIPPKLGFRDPRHAK